MIKNQLWGLVHFWAEKCFECRAVSSTSQKKLGQTFQKTTTSCIWMTNRYFNSLIEFASCCSWKSYNEWSRSLWQCLFVDIQEMLSVPHPRKRFSTAPGMGCDSTRKIPAFFNECLKGQNRKWQQFDAGMFYLVRFHRQLEKLTRTSNSSKLNYSEKLTQRRWRDESVILIRRKTIQGCDASRLRQPSWLINATLLNTGLMNMQFLSEKRIKRAWIWNINHIIGKSYLLNDAK